MNKRPNRLVNETSPYLLQHAYNPVDWYPWGDEALEKARVENKPLLVSIGYSACHWCHVMERESFENEATAAFMNEHFVNIKVDREERPDLDHIYMDAVQAMTGSGGWPLNVFLTTDGKPFYGGTYFPPTQAFNRPSWMDVLAGISRTFHENPEEISTQAQNMTSHLLQANNFGRSTGEFAFTKESTDLIFEQLMKSADKLEGGFGRAPKFPQTFSIHYLLLYYKYTGNKQALDQANLSLDKMYRGGIYDHLGGGFARYSTDAKWLVPHFEKMLYDNALLMMVYADAYQLGHQSHYKKVLEETYQFLEQELLSPEGGFYSALDADSEGQEGRYYVWDYDEVLAVTGDSAPVVTTFFDVTQDGNWEGSNILHIETAPDDFSRIHGLDLPLLTDQIERSRKLLAERRATRVKPQLDDKIILGWNALMITALCRASAATGNRPMREAALRNEEFLRTKLSDNERHFMHTYKEGKAKFPAFLDDYAFYIQALISLQELTGEKSYLLKAQDLTEYVVANFVDEDQVFFYFTHQHQRDVVIRKKEIYDGAIPSGNSVMAWNLLYLGIVFDRPDWRNSVVKMLNSLGNTTLKFPTSFGNWAALIHKLTYGVNEVVVTGGGAGVIHEQILPIFMPHKVLQVASQEDASFPLLQQKRFSSDAVIYLCKNYSCHAPVNNVDSLIRLIENE